MIEGFAHNTLRKQLHLQNFSLQSVDLTVREDREAFMCRRLTFFPMDDTTRKRNTNSIENVREKKQNYTLESLAPFLSGDIGLA